MQLVQRQQYRLRQVEGGVVGGGNDDERIGPIECLVGESVILSSEEDGDGPLLRTLEQKSCHLSRRRQRPPVTPPSRRKSSDVNTIGEGFIQRLDRANAFNDVVGIVRDPFDAVRGDLHRTHQIEVAYPHVLHRAHGSGDVDRVLRLEQHHAHAVQE